MKGDINWILRVAIVVIIALFGCDRDAPQAEEKTRILPEVQQLCSQYNAVTDWGKQLSRDEFGVHTYTIEVEDALVRTDDRPILFYGSLHDVVKNPNGYLAYFRSPSLKALRGALNAGLLSAFNYKIDFVLHCTPEQADEMTRQPRALLDDHHAVIARITKVEKVRFKLRANNGGDENIDVSLDPSDVFRAEGTCLDLLFITKESKEKQKR